MNIDWHELRLQKEWLDLILMTGTEADVRMAAGLLGLLDALQDEAASSGLVPEEEIFGTEERE